MAYPLPQLQQLALKKILDAAANNVWHEKQAVADAQWLNDGREGKAPAAIEDAQAFINERPAVALSDAQKMVDAIKEALASPFPLPAALVSDLRDLSDPIFQFQSIQAGPGGVDWTATNPGDAYRTGRDLLPVIQGMANQILARDYSVAGGSNPAFINLKRIAQTLRPTNAPKGGGGMKEKTPLEQEQEAANKGKAPVTPPPSTSSTIVGGLAGAVLGGGAGYALGPKGEERTGYTALGAAVGGVVGALVGKWMEPAAAEEKKP